MKIEDRILTIVASIILISFFGVVSVWGATILLTESTTTIGTFRTNVNTSLTNLNLDLTSATTSIGSIAALASTTGNLIVGSSTLWTFIPVGSNGKILTASSTASKGGVSWETFAGITSWGGSTSSTQTYATSGPALGISTASGVHTFSLATSTASVTGVLTGTDWSTFNNKQTSITLTGTTNIVIASSSPTWTFNFNPSLSTSTITTATTTNLRFTSATGTALSITDYVSYSDGTLQKTNYKNYGLNVLYATTTVSSTIQKMFYQAETLVQLDCSTNGASITIAGDERSSSTPQTAGTSIGANIVCDSDGFTTSTFSNATMAALNILNLNIVSTSNSTTTLRVYFKTSQD